MDKLGTFKKRFIEVVLNRSEAHAEKASNTRSAFIIMQLNKMNSKMIQQKTGMHFLVRMFHLMREIPLRASLRIRTRYCFKLKIILGDPHSRSNSQRVCVCVLHST